MKTIPTERTKTMCEEEAKIPTIEKTQLFQNGTIIKKKDGYYTNHNQKLHTPTMRIMWLLAYELSHGCKSIEPTRVSNTLNDFMVDVEKVNGGRFE